jgi:hypothetical protein
VLHFGLLFGLRLIGGLAAGTGAEDRTDGAAEDSPALVVC